MPHFTMKPASEQLQGKCKGRSWTDNIIMRHLGEIHWPREDVHTQVDFQHTGAVNAASHEWFGSNQWEQQK